MLNEFLSAMIRGKQVKDTGKTSWSKNCFSLLLLAICMFGPEKSLATSAEEILQLSEKTVNVERSSQDSHEEWVDEENRLIEEAEGIKKKVQHVDWQRQKLHIYRQDLDKKIVELRRRAKAMEAINLELLPVLETNLKKLQVSLDSDIPYNLNQRRKSIRQAQMVLNDYDSGLLDKTRAVLDAVAREVNIGHTVGIQEDEIEVAGTLKIVKMLQVGRVGLYGVTMDGKNGYQWNIDTSEWEESTENSGNIQEAMDITEGLRLVGLSRLPVNRSVQTEK